VRGTASQDSPLPRELQFTMLIPHDPLKSQLPGDARSEREKKIVESYDLMV